MDRIRKLFQLTSLSSILLITLLFNANGQSVKKYNKYIEKAEQQFDKGNFNKALKFANKLQEKSFKKFGAENQFIAVSKLKQAKYKWTLGEFKDYYALHSAALEISEKTNGANSISHGINLRDAAQNMLHYGNFVKANNYLTESMAAFESSDLADELYINNLKLMKAEILLNLGYYNEALQLTNQKEAFFLQRTLNQNKELKKDELEKSYEDAARMITLKSNILRHKGEIRRADSAFSTGEIWIKDKLKRKSKVFAKHLFHFAEFLEENGTKELPNSYYSDAYQYSISASGASHPVTLRYQEKLILNTILENNIGRASAYYKDLEKTLKTDVDKSSAYFVKLATISFESDLRKGNIKKVENAAAKLLNDQKLLPSDHPNRIDLLHTLAKVSAANSNYQNTQRYLEEIIEIKSSLYGDSSVNTAFIKVELAHHWVDHTDKFQEAVEIYDNEFFGKIDKQITDQHFTYVSLLNHLANTYQIDDNYEEASSLLDEALLVTRMKYDDRDIDFGKELNLIANLQIKIGEYEKAEVNIAETLSILENFDSEFNTVHYIKALETQAILLSIKGFFDEAENALELSQKLYSRSKPSPEYNPLVASRDLASVYLKVGKYGEAEKILSKALARNTKFY